MTFPILGGNGAGELGYQIDNSLRFNSVDSADLTFTLGTPTSQQKFTESFWLKRGLTGGQRLFKGAGVDNSNKLYYGFNSDQLNLSNTESGGVNNLFLKPNAYYRDYGAWYHVVLSVDTTQATASDRAKLYVNGEQVTDFATALYPPLNHNFVYYASGTQIQIGDGYHATVFFYDGYMAEINFIDGQALSPTDFGEFDEDSGIWKPIEYTGTFGNNGYYLDFENSGSLGADQSGNGNDFTPTNLASTDQTTDTPTNNFCTLNSLFNTSSLILKEGNLHTESSSGAGGSTSTYNISNGKWYFETCYIFGVASYPEIGIMNGNASFSDIAHTTNKESILYRPDGKIYKNNGSGFIVDQTVSTASTGDIIGIAINLNDQEISFYVNNTQVGSTVDISYMSNDIIIRLGFGYHVAKLIANFGQDSSFAGNKTRQNNSDDNGFGDFYYAPPTGFLALCTQNLATELSPTIDDGSEYFSTQTYTGNNGTTVSVDLGMQPDWTWFKKRNGNSNHGLFDTSRGMTNRLVSDDTNAEQTINNITITSTGVDVGDNYLNFSTDTYVLWGWKANAGSTSSNTDGTITSTVQANTTAGFSIVTYTGNATAGATVGHGLGKKPDMIIAKNRNTTSPSRDWLILHKSYEGTSAENMRFTTMAVASAGSQASSGWYRTAPTSSVFYLGNGSAGDYSGDTNISGGNMVAYCFAEIEGYSKFGKYTGNGSTDGTFIYTGFRPAWGMIKRTDSTSQWTIIDTTRKTFNLNDTRIHPNLSDAEYSGDGYGWDMLSNGFKQRTTVGDFNGSGGTYIYMAFAENPFVSSKGVPVTAR